MLIKAKLIFFTLVQYQISLVLWLSLLVPNPDKPPSGSILPSSVSQGYYSKLEPLTLEPKSVFLPQ